MIRFLADENFNNGIIRGIKRQIPDVEILRVQDTNLISKPDPKLLEWAAENDYIVLSHDVNTMRGFYYDRLKDGKPNPGLFLVHGDKPIGKVIESIVLVIQISELEEWAGKIQFLPL